MHLLAKIRKPKKSSFYAFFSFCRKIMEMNPNQQNIRRLNIHIFHEKKNIAKWIWWTFCNIFLLEKLTFFSNKGIMVEKILHAIAVFEPNLLEPIGVRVQAD